MGNSEVGHLTIGSGRILYQDLMRVNKAIEDGSFFENPALRGAFERGRNVHLLGLVSYGGVHSHIDHLKALLRFAPEKTWIHAFTDGRDVSPHAAVRDLAELPQERIATVSGRYYAMDRDQRWERTDRAFDAIVRSSPATATDPVAYVQQQYDAGITDEFVEPVHFEGRPGIEPGDTVIFFNFRPDRARQLSQRLLEARLRPDDDDPVPRRPGLSGRLRGAGRAEHARRGARRTAAPASCTAPRPRSTRMSPTSSTAAARRSGRARRGSSSLARARSGTYDQKPEMSAPEVADRFAAEIGDGYRFGIVNFANPDMVGHTGSIPAAVAAFETTDRCLGRVLDAVDERGRRHARHRRPRQRRDDARRRRRQPVHGAHDQPGTAPRHPPGGTLREGGELSDLAPTCLDLLGITEPPEMTGTSLVSARA